MIWLGMRYPGGKPKALTLSYDDGVQQDETLIRKMQAHGIRGTFHLNSGLFSPEDVQFEPGQIHRVMTLKEARFLYLSSGMEVALHGVDHPFLDKLPLPVAAYQVGEDRRRLEKWFGAPIQGMSYPFGTYSDQVVELLRALGIHYSRTTQSHHSFAQPADWLRLGATCHHNDPRLMELAKAFVEGSPDRERYPMDPWLFYLWGHSYEFEQQDNWQVIEDFFQLVGDREDIWYATNGEIYDYTLAYKRLEFSLECTMVKNPSAASVWIYWKGQTLEIPGGAEISLP